MQKQQEIKEIKMIFIKGNYEVDASSVLRALNMYTRGGRPLQFEPCIKLLFQNDDGASLFGLRKNQYITFGVRYRKKDYRKDAALIDLILSKNFNYYNRPCSWCGHKLGSRAHHDGITHQLCMDKISKLEH